MATARRAIAIALVVLVCVTALAAGGCTPAAQSPAPAAKIGPPLIKQPGVLRVGVDLDYPPFGGTANGRQAGLDLDVASAIAGRLGLTASFVNVKASQIATALSQGEIDIAMSAPFSADLLSRATIAGTYVTDAPVLFTTGDNPSAEGSAGVDALQGVKIGAQQGSEAYWRLLSEFGSGAVVSYPTLREAFDGLTQGQISYVGADALVGAYIARDEPGVRYAGAIAPAHLLGVAVNADNTKLADSMRQTLDSLAADGALDAIRSTWVGALPKLPIVSADTSSASPDTPTAP